VLMISRIAIGGLKGGESGLLWWRSTSMDTGRYRERSCGGRNWLWVVYNDEQDTRNDSDEMMVSSRQSESLCNICVNNKRAQARGWLNCSGHDISRSPQTNLCRWARYAPEIAIHVSHEHMMKETAKDRRMRTFQRQETGLEWVKMVERQRS
jgi:hypothetical protein